MSKLSKTYIVNTNNGNKSKADILSKSDKMLKVALEGTMLTILLKRTDTNKNYVGSLHNMEFTSTGEEL